MNSTDSEEDGSRRATCLDPVEDGCGITGDMWMRGESTLVGDDTWIYRGTAH